MNWRPTSGSLVVLSDADLAKIGLTAVLEAQAKATAQAALKGLASLSSEEWHDLDKSQFKQIAQRLIVAAGNVAPPLKEMALQLDVLRANAQDSRHAVVHAMWAIGEGDEPTAYDIRRTMWLSRQDIDEALSKCAAASIWAKRCMYAVAELIQDGRLPEGDGSATGPSIRTTRRLVHL